MPAGDRVAREPPISIHFTLLLNGFQGSCLFLILLRRHGTTSAGDLAKSGTNGIPVDRRRGRLRARKGVDQNLPRRNIRSWETWVSFGDWLTSGSAPALGGTAETGGPFARGVFRGARHAEPGEMDDAAIQDERGPGEALSCQPEVLA
jgi:hypothetical protein